MDIKVIQNLINRFKEGQCTLEEEQILFAFFTDSSSKIPAEWEVYATYFKNIETIRDIEVANNFDESIMLTEQEMQETTITKMTWLNDLWIVVAAAVVGGLLFTMNVVNEMTKPLPNLTSNQTIAADYTEEEVKKAYQEVVHIMQFVSEKLNRGKKPLEEIKRIETINNKIKQRKYETL